MQKHPQVKLINFISFSKQIAAMILDHQKRYIENEEKRETLKRQWNSRHHTTTSSGLPAPGGGGIRRIN
jgi:hypothetical protein